MKRFVVVAYMTTVATCILVIFALAALLIFAPARPASARGDDDLPYIPNVIPSPQEHAWCYVLVNDNRAVGNIHMLSCVPKE